MIASKYTAPFYTKLAMTLVSAIALGYIFIHGKLILSPLLFSFLFSVVLIPVANFFEKRLRLPRSASSGLSVIVMVLFIVGILFFVGTQMTNLAQDWPLFKESFLVSSKNFQRWVGSTFHINMSEQLDYLHTATDKLISASTAIIGTTVLSLSSFLLFIVFVLIDTFFLLLYRRHIIKFIIAVFTEEHSATVYEVLEKIQYIVRKYITGLFLQMVIVASLCCIAFAIIGIKYAILLGIITGLFNVIPYIGIFTALLLSVAITIGTAATTTHIILVAVIIIIVHLIDSNFLLPIIVGSKVKINALITLLGVIVGEMFWGIPGMFLSIPIIAVVKIIFDHTEGCKPWGYLLGEEDDEELKPILNKNVEKEVVITEAEDLKKE